MGVDEQTNSGETHSFAEILQEFSGISISDIDKDKFYQDLIIKILENFGYTSDDFFRLSEVYFYRSSCEQDSKIDEKIRRNEQEGAPTIKKEMHAALRLISLTDVPGYFDEEVKATGGRIEIQDIHPYSIIAKYNEWDLYELYEAETAKDLDKVLAKLVMILSSLVPVAIIEQALKGTLAEYPTSVS